MEIIGNAFAQGIVPGVVIAIVYVVEKIISNRKKDPLNDIAKLLNIVTKDIIEKDKEKSKAIVKVALSYGGSEYIKFVNTTIVNNNIDVNREQIEFNAKQLVASVFYDVYSKLNLYRGDTDYLSHYMKEEWKDEIYNDIINIIYNEKIDKDHRIIAFNSRIEIRITKYCAHIINSAFK